MDTYHIGIDKKLDEGTQYGRVMACFVGCTGSGFGMHLLVSSIVVNEKPLPIYKRTDLTS